MIKYVIYLCIFLFLAGCDPTQQDSTSEYWHFKRSEGHFREGDTVLVFTASLPIYSSLQLNNANEVVRITYDTLTGTYERTDTTLKLYFPGNTFDYTIEYATADSMVLRWEYIPDSAEVVDYFSK